MTHDAEDQPSPSLDRSSREPLWQQLTRVLRDQIGTDGGPARLPPEHALAARYQVSRHTVRAALEELRAAGLLERRRRRGTFVVSPGVLEQPLRGLYSFTETAARSGRPERSIVLEAGRVRSADVAKRLGLDPRRALVRIRRLRLVDEEPVVLSTAWYGRDIGDRLLRSDLTRGALYDALAQHAGVRVTGGWERISAAQPTPEERRLLAMDRDEAVMRVERLATAASNPVEFRVSVMRGSRYQLVASWDDPDVGRG